MPRLGYRRVSFRWRSERRTTRRSTSWKRSGGTPKGSGGERQTSSCARWDPVRGSCAAQEQQVTMGTRFRQMSTNTATMDAVTTMDGAAVQMMGGGETVGRSLKHVREEKNLSLD